MIGWIIALIAIAILYFIATLDIGALYKFVLAIIELGIVGIILRKVIKPWKGWEIDSYYGFILFKTKKGLKKIDEIAQKRELWNFFADVGLVMGYGVFSLVIMRKHLDWKKFVLGMILLSLLYVFVVPFAIPFIITNLKGQTMTGAVSESASSDGVLPWIGLAISYLFGMFGMVFAGIVQNGYFILERLVGVVLGVAEISAENAGVTLILPGINIPLVEGILALFVILVVHEGAHAILGRVAKVPMKSSGVILFGVIPIGAFVEPDEGWLGRLEKRKQTRVMIAGPAANFICAIIVFFLFIGFLSVTADYREQGMLVLEGLDYGTIVYSVNGYDIKSNYSLNAGETVLLQTNLGEIEKTVDEEGMVGIKGYYLSDPFIVKYKDWWMNFVYTTLGFIFSLNFIIGAINLLPIPAFDGYRIVELNIKSRDIVKALMYISVLGLLMNFLPWLF